jgi:hypothetical protein
MESVDPSVHVKVAADTVKLPYLAHCQCDRAQRLEGLG